MDRPVPMDLLFDDAIESDAAAIAALRNAASDDLTARYGPGFWSTVSAEKGVLREVGNPRFSHLMVARHSGRIVGSLRLVTKKPWAIDTAYFTQVKRPLYLVSMVVDPGFQRQGVGRRLIREAEAVARAWPSDAIRLDAFDAFAGAGPFYAKCGYREVARVVYRNDPLVYFELVF